MTAQLLSLPLPIRSTDPAATRPVSAVAATLPRSFRPARAEEAAVEVIAGADWLLRVHERAARARGIILLDPPYADPGSAAPVGTRLACPVLVDAAGSGNAVVGDARAAIANAIRDGGPSGAGWRLECRVSTPGDRRLQTVLAHQLFLIRTLVAATGDLRLISWSDTGYVVAGRAGRLDVDLTAIRTDVLPAATTVRLLTDDGGVMLWLPLSDTARPAALTVTTADGELRSPTRWEAGHRTTWRRLVDLLSGATTDARPGLPELVADLAAVTSLLGGR